MQQRQVQYFKMDMLRSLRSWKYGAAILAVVVVLFILTSIYRAGTDSVINLIMMIPLGGIGGALLWPICAFPCVGSLCEDIENRYYQMMILRGNMRRYLIAKAGAVFLVSGSVMFIGFLIFTGYLCTKYPLYTELISSEYIADTIMGNMHLTDQYVLILFVIGLQFSFLAGTLAVVALAVSAFLQNRMLVYTIPVVFLYLGDTVIVRFLGNRAGNLLSLFRSAYRSVNFQEQGQPWYFTYLLMAVIVIISFLLMEMRMERRLAHG